MCLCRPSGFGSKLMRGLGMAVRVIPLMTCCTVAWAQTESTLPRTLLKDESEADQQFFEAKQKAGEQKWVEALRLFERAWNLKPSYDIAGNLGQVALKLGLYTKAATYLDQCLHLFPATGSTAQRSQVESLFREASAHVAAAHFMLISNSGDLVLDRVVELGSARDPLGTVYVNPGTHIVQIRQDGKVVVEQSFLAVANASQQVHVGIAENPTPASPPQPGADSAAATSVGSRPSGSSSDGEARSAVPIILGASFSAASFIAAAALLNSAKNSMDQSDALKHQISPNNQSSTCRDNTSADCKQLIDALERADRRYNWSHVTLGVGAVSLVATLVYGFWPVKRSHSLMKSSAGDQRLPIEIQATPGSGMFTLRATF